MINPSVFIIIHNYSVMFLYYIQGCTRQQRQKAYLYTLCMPLGLNHIPAELVSFFLSTSIGVTQNLLNFWPHLHINLLHFKCTGAQYQLFKILCISVVLLHCTHVHSINTRLQKVNSQKVFWLLLQASDVWLWLEHSPLIWCHLTGLHKKMGLGQETFQSVGWHGTLQHS